MKNYLLTLNWMVKDFNSIGPKKKTFLNIFPGMLINASIIYTGISYLFIFIEKAMIIQIHMVVMMLMVF